MRELRQERGWTIEDLASRAGVSSRTIYDIEGGHRQPHRATRQVLAHALGRDPEALEASSGRENFVESGKEDGVDHGPA